MRLRALLCNAVFGTAFAATSAWAVETDRASRPMPIALDEIRNLSVSTTGQVISDQIIGLGGNSARGAGCQQIASHTDAAFSGSGQFVLQLGFVDDEVAAASYVIPANQFPIRLESIEMIFGTTNATVQTSTAWTVFIWQGLPNTGTIVGQFSSGDGILPEMIIGPGTAALNLQIVVDPNDPEQIIIQNDGSATFSVGVRIDEHHAPPSLPCFIPPLENQNAFPATDTSGLLSPQGNWLFGINCGAFGCPANGGWARFSQLPAGCRPSNDWALRATYTPTSCQPGVGACCLLTGVCDIRLQADCASNVGIYQGDGTNCQTASCPQPTGACCFQATGGCINLTADNCSRAGGVYSGNGTACGTTVCFPTGACCLPAGNCIGPVSPGDCAAQGGTFRGNNTSCATQNCPQPTGGCCFPNNFCLVLTQVECGNAGANWRGAGTNCDGPAPCAAGPTCGPCADSNCDGFVTVGDIGYFVDAVVGGVSAWSNRFGGTAPCDFTCANDANGDNFVTVGDISAFVQAVSSGQPCPG